MFYIIVPSKFTNLTYFRKKQYQVQCKNKNSAEGYVAATKNSFPLDILLFDFRWSTSKSASYTGVAETRPL